MARTDNLYHLLIEGRSLAISLLNGDPRWRMYYEEISPLRPIRDRSRLLPAVDGKVGFLEIQGACHRFDGAYISVLCQCGKTHRLKRYCVNFRAKHGVGCMLPGCSFMPDAIRVWVEPQFALRMQMSLLLAGDRGLICNDWGGSAEGEITVDPGSGIDRFIRDTEKLRAELEEDGKWWFVRFDPTMPYALDNLSWSHLPQWEVFEPVARSLIMGGTSYTLSEVADIFGLSLSSVRKIRYSEASDEKCIERLTALSDATAMDHITTEEKNKREVSTGNERLNFKWLSANYNETIKGDSLAVVVSGKTNRSYVRSTLKRYGLEEHKDYSLVISVHGPENEEAPLGKLILTITRLSASLMNAQAD